MKDQRRLLYDGCSLHICKDDNAQNDSAVKVDFDRHRDVFLSTFF
jgi:hypothetical protein